MKKIPDPSRSQPWTPTLANQRGAVLVLFAFALFVLLGFSALAIEAGYWYMVRAELSKSIDAGALAGAKNISNPWVDPLVLAQEFAQANFPTGYAGTPAVGSTGAVSFSVFPLDDYRIQVTGSVSALSMLAQLSGVNQITTNASAVAKKNKVEIMLVLDRSGSMAYSGKMTSLKSAASSFVNCFQTTQNDDKMGLISFAGSVQVNRPLGTNYVDDMLAAIVAMNPYGATNTEDALNQSDGPQGFTDQSGLAGDQRVQQVLILLTDGMPTAFRGTFINNGMSYDGVAYVEATVGYENAMNCRPGPGEETQMDVQLNQPNMEAGAGSSLGISPTPTGDGQPVGSSQCGSVLGPTTEWAIFASYPVPGYAPLACNIPPTNVVLNTCTIARDLAVDQSTTLKSKGIKIYVIGLGTGDEIDSSLLLQISSGSSFLYVTPNPGDLQAIFNAIAKDIKLRLVQ